MKAVYKITIFLAAITAVLSCREDNGKAGLNEDGIMLTEVQDSVFSADGGDIRIVFSSASAWTAATDRTWCGVSASEGEAGENIALTVSAEANTGESERQAVLTICTGGSKASLTLLQKGTEVPGILRLTHSDTEFQVPAVSGGLSSEWTVDWGDNSVFEDYSESLSHIYESGGSHTVTIYCSGAEQVTIENISGITDLDISEF
ncbi:MAG TPA: BACON domain-containing protein [Candidatus Coprenecus pullistercoris]|nr:BACON domain-containing protein [Candidatus Coprenecus pullistercoris]